MDIARDLKPALVAISGGLGDIGASIARVLARAGADVAIADHLDDEHADPLLSDLQKIGVRGYYRRLDVRDYADSRSWYDDVEAFYGRTPNLIVANAAVVTLKPLLEIAPEEWLREIQVNLSGSYFFSRFGAERLIRGDCAGRIVFLGSWAAHAPHRALPAYSVAKAGLRMLSKCLALELAPSGILVNEVAPGYVDAGLSGRIFKKDASAREGALKGVPIGRLIGAEDVANQVLLLCSDFFAHMTGSVVLQDGGLSLLQGPFTE